MEPHDVIEPGDRVAVFVDAANVESAARELGYRIDWDKVLDHFRADGRFAGAYYYTAQRDGDDGQREFLHAIAEKGYIVRTKPLKTIHTGHGHTTHKGNLDIEIALDMVASAGQYDVAYLLSGDSDFRRVVETLQSQGKRVYAVSGRDSLSEEILEIANKPVYYLDDLEDAIAIPE